MENQIEISLIEKEIPNAAGRTFCLERINTPGIAADEYLICNTIKTADGGTNGWYNHADVGPNSKDVSFAMIKDGERVKIPYGAELFLQLKPKYDKKTGYIKATVFYKLSD